MIPVVGEFSVAYTIPGDGTLRHVTHTIAVVPAQLHAIAPSTQAKTIDGRLDEWTALTVACEHPAEI